MRYILFIVSLTIIALSACKIEETQNISSGKDSNMSFKEKTNIDTNKNINQTIDSITQWVGTYKYFESWKELNGITSATMDYTLRITRKDINSLVGNLNIEGFQTTTKKKCSITFTKEKMNVYADNLIQFSLERTPNGKLITNWFNLQPAVIDNQKNGKVRFKKSK